MRDLAYTLFAIAVAMIGYHIHGSFFWAFVDLLFAPLAVVKWLIYHEISLSVIQQTFDFLQH